MNSLYLLTNSVLKNFLSLFIKTYQLTLSKVFYASGVQCRFYPSCSEFALSCLKDEQNHFLSAVTKIFFRLLKCQPFHPGGVDLP